MADKIGNCTGTRAEAGTAEVYQLAPEAMSLMMSYVIVTPGKKLVVIDGGIDGEGIDAPPYLPNALRAILGLKENDYFEVEAWFLTHAHRDHFYELAKMLNGYTPESNYKINNFYFDFPDIGGAWKSAAGESDQHLKRLDLLKRGFENYFGVNGVPCAKGSHYDRLNGAVINSGTVGNGLTITVDGVRFRILATWWREAKYTNSTCVVMRMEYAGQSILFLADAAADAGARLLELYPAEELRSDYVQMGHHGQNGPDKAFYDAIHAKNSIRLWPTPSWVWKDHVTFRTGETRSWLGLPEDAAEFEKRGLMRTGRDLVAGMLPEYPGRGEIFENWTREILDLLRVAVPGKINQGADR